MLRSMIGGLALSLAVIAPAATQDITETPDTGTAPILTVLTSDAPQTQLMALILTRASAAEGVPVRILLCDGAGDLALTDPPETVTAPLAPRGMSPHGLLGMLIDQGVTVQVCAIYLPNSSHEAGDLIDGVSVATPPEIAAVMADPATRLFTF